MLLLLLVVVVVVAAATAAVLVCCFGDDGCGGSGSKNSSNIPSLAFLFDASVSLALSHPISESDFRFSSPVVANTNSIIYSY
jgi:hypothetical protein